MNTTVKKVQRVRMRHEPLRRVRLREDRAVGVMVRSKYRAIATTQGVSEARQIALDDLLGLVTWLSASIGARATYEVIQQHADDLVADAVERQSEAA